MLAKTILQELCPGEDWVPCFLFLGKKLIPGQGGLSQQEGRGYGYINVAGLGSKTYILS